MMVNIDPEDKGALKKNVGRRLKWLREFYRLDQDEFAQQVGLTQAGYSYFETGGRLMKVEYGIKVCEEFAVTLDWIYRGDPSSLAPDIWRQMRAFKAAQDKDKSDKLLDGAA